MLKTKRSAERNGNHLGTIIINLIFYGIAISDVSRKEGLEKAHFEMDVICEAIEKGKIWYLIRTKICRFPLI